MLLFPRFLEANRAVENLQAQIEARLLMLSSNNLLKPADGEPVIMDNPQDIVLGAYYLTKMRFSERDSVERRFASPLEARAAYEAGRITLHQPIMVRMNGALVETTVGRQIFNEAMPPEIGFINRTVDKRDIKRITADVYRILGTRRTAEFVARRLGRLAGRHQVICITHLPQIASAATRHVRVEKRVEKDRTFTGARELGREERVEEIARLVSGSRLTEASRQIAREMLDADHVKG